MNEKDEALKYIDELKKVIHSQKAEIERLKAEADMADGYADALEKRAVLVLNLNIISRIAKTLPTQPRKAVTRNEQRHI